MANERLDILINARNQASGAIQQVKGELGGLKQETTGIGSVGTLMGGALAAGLAIAGSAALRAVGDMAQLGAQTEMLRASLQSLASSAGTSSQEIVSALRASSQGMIAEQDLILGANRALMLGVAKNSEDMVALMQVATVRGRAMGLSVTQAFNDIVTGLGRGSALILDNLGIVVDAEATNRAYAASLGKTASELTEVEKKQALVNSVLAEGQKLTAQSATDATLQADSYARLAAAWKDFRANAGEAIGTLGSPIAAGAAYALEAVNGTLDTRAALIAQLIVLQNKLNDIDINTHPEAAQEYKRLEGAIAAVTAEYNQLGPEISSIYGAQIREAAATRDSADAYRDKAAAAREALEATLAQQAGQVRSQLLGLSGDLGGQKALQLSEDLNRKLQERTDIMVRYGMTADQIEFSNAAWIDQNISGLRDQIAEQNKLETAVTKTSAAASVLNAEYEKLSGTVASVLQGALDPGVGVNPDDLLPRPDAINENARRLAAIAVEGFKGQEWLADFQNDVPDIAKALQEAADPKAAAAQLLKDFQDGLVPELIDKEAAKDRVRRMITGEATMAQLAAEIAQELSAEMGISLAQATQATNSALGGGGAAQLGDAGGTAQAAFGDGFNGQPVGVAFVDGLTTAIVERYSALEASGEQAGVTWRTGFLATTTVDIPTALILALTTLVTPEVQKALDAQKSRTGAY